MSREYRRLYVLDSSGTTRQVKLHTWGSDRAALDLLKAACPEKTAIVVEFPDPEYLTLTQKVCFVGDFSLSRNLRHLHKFVAATKGTVEGFLWLVKAHYACDDESYPLGVYKSHSKALEAAEAYDAKTTDEDEYATIELIRYHD